MKTFRQTVDEAQQLVAKLDGSFVDVIINMADSIRQLADFLEQNPESLLRGKGN